MSSEKVNAAFPDRYRYPTALPPLTNSCVFKSSKSPSLSWDWINQCKILIKQANIFSEVFTNGSTNIQNENGFSYMQILREVTDLSPFYT